MKRSRKAVGDPKPAWLGLIGALVAARRVVAFQDNTALIDRLRGHEIRLRRQAHFDGLTGLANRTHFHDQVAHALSSAEASVLLIDLDGCKAVNDTMGRAHRPRADRRGAGSGGGQHRSGRRRPGADVNSLLRDADLPMYGAKRQGKGTWLRHHEAMPAWRAKV